MHSRIRRGLVTDNPSCLLFHFIHNATVAKTPHRGVGTLFTRTELDFVLGFYMWLLIRSAVKLWSALCMSVQQKPVTFHLLSLPLHVALLWASVLIRVTLHRFSTEESYHLIIITQTWTLIFKSAEL